MARTVLELGEGEGFRVFGPARLSVAEGSLLVLGVELSKGASIEIDARRSYYIVSPTGARVLLEVGAGARIDAPSPGEESSLEWIRAVDEAIDSCPLPCRIIALGPVESGKTSLAALVANRAFTAGLRPYIIDADIGQADIGPPGFVSGSLPEKPVVWLRELEPDRMVFVGHIEPSHVQVQITYGVLRLLARAEEMRANMVVVDTDGWVEGWHALESKMLLLRAVDPHAVLVLGSEDLYRFVRDRWPGRVYLLPSPRVQARRTVRDRAVLRSENYKRFLHGSSIRELSLDRTPILNSCLPPSAGLHKGREPAVYPYPGGVCALYTRQDPPQVSEAKGLIQQLGVREAMVVYTGGFRGVLVGLVGIAGWDHPGVIERIDMERRVLRVRTPYLGPVRMIIAGRVRIGDSYTDTGARRVWV